MSKRELIKQIMHHNRSARREFLEAFTENELSDYLRQLESIRPQHAPPQRRPCPATEAPLTGRPAAGRSRRSRFCNLERKDDLALAQRSPVGAAAGQESGVP